MIREWNMVHDEVLHRVDLGGNGGASIRFHEERIRRSAIHRNRVQGPDPSAGEPAFQLSDPNLSVLAERAAKQELVLFADVRALFENDCTFAHSRADLEPRARFGNIACRGAVKNGDVR